MNRTRNVASWVLGLFFVLAGANHFVDPDFYVAIMPPYVPFHLTLVYVSGISEIALGLLVLPRATRSLAGWGLVVLLIAVFPANLHMALNEVPIDGEPAGPPWALYLRLPLQGLLIAWAWWATRKPQKPPRPLPSGTRSTK